MIELDIISILLNNCQPYMLLDNYRQWEKSIYIFVISIIFGSEEKKSTTFNKSD